MRRNGKFRFVVFVVTGLVLGITGCKNSQTGGNENYVSAASDIADSFPLKAEPVDVNPQKPQSDGPYAIVHTTAGDIKILLYPEEAPKAVENFITLAKEGYYDGTDIYYVKRHEIFQTGKPIADKDTAETLPDGQKAKYEIERSAWTDPFEDEVDNGLYNYCGSVGMAGEGMDNNLSQFYVILSDATPEDDRLVPANLYMNELIRKRSKELNEKAKESTMSEEDLNAFQDKLNEEIQAIGTDGVPEEASERYQDAIDGYNQYGGMWQLDYTHTVFGQIVDGFNVANAITEVRVDPSTRSPKKDILINSIEIIE